jgi:rubrerythrin
MKTKLYVALVLGGALLFVIGNLTASGAGSLNENSQANLSTAMHGEAFAYAKYLLYAKEAQRNGNTELADLFTQAAKTERFQHFAEEAELAGLVGSDADNLKDAIKGESYEVDTMYRKFAEQAKTAGDKAAADRFEEIRQDEMSHRDDFRLALTQVEKKPSGGQ